MSLIIGGLTALMLMNRMPHLIWSLLRRLLRNPRTVWRISARTWAQEQAVGLQFQHGCPNCAWWDGASQTDLASRLHGAIDHVYFTGDGLRMGVHVPDRWASCSSSAAVAIWRHEPGMNLHRIEPNAEDILDLRYVATDSPWIHPMARPCGLPADSPQYCAQWGRWLQEVLGTGAPVEPWSTAQHSSKSPFQTGPSSWP